MKTPPIDLHHWLRRVPVPSKLRLDGKKILIIGSGKSRWRDAVEHVQTMRPALLEAMNDDDHVLRVTEKLAGTEEEETDEEAAKKFAGQTQLAQLAGILMEVGDRAALRHGEAYSLAFEKNNQLVQMLVDRLTGAEAALEQMRGLVGELKEGGDETGNVIGKLIELAGARAATSGGKKG